VGSPAALVTFPLRRPGLVLLQGVGDRQTFIALNGGPHFKFTEAISLLVDCKTQEEVDDLWEKLSAGGGKR
jgi:predicted 3-demethylubiquinone-9 3-methyltransferase (glyoxalase superfamily)